MTIIACVDSNLGMRFNNRPQSRDKVIAAKLSEDVTGITFDIVNAPSEINWAQVDTVILYKWNRVYPADEFFKWPADASFVLQSFDNFEGYSHQVITKEVYKRI